LQRLAAELADASNISAVTGVGLALGLGLLIARVALDAGAFRSGRFSRNACTVGCDRRRQRDRNPWRPARLPANALDGRTASLILPARVVLNMVFMTATALGVAGWSKGGGR